MDVMQAETYVRTGSGGAARSAVDDTLAGCLPTRWSPTPPAAVDPHRGLSRSLDSLPLSPGPPVDDPGSRPVDPDSRSGDTEPTGANVFGETVGEPAGERTSMSMGIDLGAVVERTAAPVDAPRERLDVRELGPPKPLANTLERLAALDDETVLVQLNDRAPQHLYPKLDDRGYEYATVEADGVTVTAIWTA